MQGSLHIFGPGGPPLPSRGFGTYGLSPEAYEDVQRLYPYFKDYTWQNILYSQQLYELANQAFADLLLKNLQEYIPEDATKEQVFDIIQKAWNLGLTGFKNGRETVASRIKRAEEFKAIWSGYLMEDKLELARLVN